MSRGPAKHYCPECKAVTESEVLDSRLMFEGRRRRRECMVCLSRQTTYEVREDLYRKCVASRDVQNTLRKVLEDLG